MKAFRTLSGGGWRRAVCIVLAASAIGSVALPGVRLWQETAAHEWRVLGLGALAQARLAAGADRYALQRYEWSAGKVASLPLTVIAADPKIDRTRARLLGIAVEAGWRGLGAGGAAALAALVLLAGWRHSTYGGGSEKLPAPGGRSTKHSPVARSRKPPSQTGRPAKKADKAAPPPASAGPANAGREHGERPENRPVPRRRRRRAGRWI